MSLNRRYEIDSSVIPLVVVEIEECRKPYDCFYVIDEAPGIGLISFNR